ncbi:MAG: N-acetylneuraminate synthase [Methanomicrobiales archaeon]|nr:N-acetylneuraminate synthase [Methanomicrobiales archaeon]
MKPLHIGERPVGTGHPCFIIAEAGVNHNGDVACAELLIDEALRAGADAVKFQTFSADALVSRHAGKAAYQKRGGDDDESQHAMLRRLELGPDDFSRLARYARTKGIRFLSSPFDRRSVDTLVDIGVPAIKFGSGELTNIPLLEYAGSLQVPIILSTGMAYLGEIEEALAAVRRGGCTDTALLHCVSRYPADPADQNLRTLPLLSSAFGVPVGYSDHTPGVHAAVCAVALGACIVEKHFTLDRGMEGPDHAMSLDPPAFAGLVAAIRETEDALGDGIKRPAAGEDELRVIARKSIVAAQNIAKGTVIRPEMLAVKRPATGIAPKHLAALIGSRMKKDVEIDEIITWDCIE